MNFKTVQLIFVFAALLVVNTSYGQFDNLLKKAGEKAKSVVSNKVETTKQRIGKAAEDKATKAAEKAVDKTLNGGVGTKNKQKQETCMDKDAVSFVDEVLMPVLKDYESKHPNSNRENFGSKQDFKEYQETSQKEILKTISEKCKDCSKMKEDKLLPKLNQIISEYQTTSRSKMGVNFENSTENTLLNKYFITN